MTSLRTVNLNLIPVLQALLKCRSVKDAAASLNLSQAATSEALSRLRALLHDDLLVRVGGGMQLTPFALGLIEPVEAACCDIGKLLFRDAFDPSESDHEFVVSCWDYLGLILGPAFARLLSLHAPRMRLRLVPDGTDLARRMANREVHFALLPSFAIEDMAPAPLRFRPLFKDGTMVLADRNHPIAVLERLTQDDLLCYRHVFFVPPAIASNSRRVLTLSGGAEIDVAVRTTHMMLAPELVRGTPYISLLPARFTASLQSDPDFVIRPVDVEAANFTMGIAWSTVFDTEQAHLWFRNLLLNHDQAASNAPSPDDPNYPSVCRPFPGPSEARAGSPIIRADQAAATDGNIGLVIRAPGSSPTISGVNGPTGLK